MLVGKRAQVRSTASAAREGPPRASEWGGLDTDPPRDIIVQDIYTISNIQYIQTYTTYTLLVEPWQLEQILVNLWMWAGYTATVVVNTAGILSKGKMEQM